jgi:hypothetical protein
MQMNLSSVVPVMAIPYVRAPPDPDTLSSKSRTNSGTGFSSFIPRRPGFSGLSARGLRQGGNRGQRKYGRVEC